MAMACILWYTYWSCICFCMDYDFLVSSLCVSQAFTACKLQVVDILVVLVSGRKPNEFGILLETFDRFRVT